MVNLVQIAIWRNTESRKMPHQNTLTAEKANFHRPNRRFTPRNSIAIFEKKTQLPEYSLWSRSNMLNWESI